MPARVTADQPDQEPSSVPSPAAASVRQAAAVWTPIDALQPWAANPRDNAKAIAEVAKSIRRFGWGAPIVANERNGEVIAGHTRLAAAQTGRVARLMELDPRYCDVIRRRWARWAKANGVDAGSGALDG